MLDLAGSEPFQDVPAWLSREYTNQYAAIEIAPDTEDGEGSVVTGIRSNFGGPQDGQVVSGLDTLVVTTTRIVKAPRATVRRVVAKWASVISKNTIEGVDDAEGLLGAARTCFIPGLGPSTSERVTVYDEEAGTFAYEVLQGAPPFADKAVNTWTITSVDAAGTARRRWASTAPM